MPIYTLPEREKFTWDGLTICGPCRAQILADYPQEFRADDFTPGGSDVRCAHCGYHFQPLTFEVYETTAPEDYDGFGTITLRPAKAPRGPRIVGVLPEHREWQLNRYGSGLYPATTAEWDAEADKARQSEGL